MKKIIIFIALCFLLISKVEAKEIVTLNKCVDGDTAWFNLNDEVIKVRFLAIDAPEATNTIEKYGKEASDFTCNLLNSSKKIEIEYDENSNQKDKYERHLVWVFVDDVLLQDLIIKQGLAEVDYLYDDYKYTNILQSSQLIAKNNKIGIWQENNDSPVFLLIIIIVITIMGCCFSKKIRKKLTNKIKSKTEKQIIEYIEKL